MNHFKKAGFWLGVPCIVLLLVFSFPSFAPAEDLDDETTNSLPTLETVDQAREMNLERIPLEMKTLKNGMRLILAPNSDNRILAIGVFMPLGAKLELASEGGITNLTQQLLIKGTTTRSAEEIADCIESVGGSISSSANDDFCAISTVTTIPTATGIPAISTATATTTATTISSTK